MLRDDIRSVAALVLWNCRYLARVFSHRNTVKVLDRLRMSTVMSVLVQWRCPVQELLEISQWKYIKSRDVIYESLRGFIHVYGYGYHTFSLCVD